LSKKKKTRLKAGKIDANLTNAKSRLADQKNKLRRWF
jgi:hypothetical protein